MVVKGLEQTREETVLRRLIRERGFRRGWICERAGIHPTVLGYLINGQRPVNRRYADRLAPVLGVSPDDLMEPSE